MRPNWPKLTSLAQKTCTLDSFSSLVLSLLLKDNCFTEHIYLSSDNPQLPFTLLHQEKPKLFAILAFLSAIWLKIWYGKDSSRFLTFTVISQEYVYMAKFCSR